MMRQSWIEIHPCSNVILLSEYLFVDETPITQGIKTTGLQIGPRNSRMARGMNSGYGERGGRIGLVSSCE